MKEEFIITETFMVAPSIIYRAWLDSEEHSKMTGGAAVCSNIVGESFTAWDGYIKGKNISLKEDEEIVQSWRSTQFDDADEDSLLNLELKSIEGGTEILLHHSNIPQGQTQYLQGWVDHYFAPMKEYFEK